MLPMMMPRVNFSQVGIFVFTSKICHFRCRVLFLLTWDILSATMDETPSAYNGYVVSDLHIFGCSSLYERLLPRFYQEVGSHTITVLNGDIFDFKRSIFSSSAETARHALSWLRDLSARLPHAKIFYLLGNHDSQNEFVRALKQSLPELPNVSLIEDSLRLGNSLFIHGDVVDLPPDAYDLALVRSRYMHLEPNRKSRVFANLVTHLRINSVEHLRHSRASLARRILRYLDSTQPGYRDSVKEVFFGHTHVPFRHFEYEGIIFRNTGSMVRGLQWRPLEFSA